MQASWTIVLLVIMWLYRQAQLLAVMRFITTQKKTVNCGIKKCPSCGRVIIEDDVEIGAGCTIDRGVSHDTIIGKGSKLDNMVHIGHDTVTR